MKTLRYRSLAIIIGMLFCWIVPHASFADYATIDGIYYSLNEQELTAGVTKKDYSGDIIIPESIVYNGQTYAVTSIIMMGGFSVEDNYSLKSVTIPNSVTQIGVHAFLNCTGLTSVTLGNGVEYIGLEAFAGCTGLTSITVDAGNTFYDSRNDCNAIIETATNTLIVGSNNTIIPNSVTSIGDGAFYGCTGLTSVTIPNSVTSIGVNAFYGCTGLTSVTIGNSVSSIGYSAFEGCTGLTSITVDAGNTFYDSRNDCNAIIEAATNTLIVGCYTTVIPKSVTKIGRHAFYDLSYLTTLTIPSSVTYIGESAFYGCTGLTSIIFYGETPPSIDIDFEWGAFYEVNKTSCTLHVPNGSKSAYENAEGWSEFQNIVEFNKVLATGSCGDNVNYIIYSDLSMVISGTGEMYDFYSDIHINDDWYLYIEELIIEDGVTSIGDYAFSFFNSLTSVTIPNSVTSIGNYAFSFSNSLTSMTIPNSVTSIGSNAFIGCTGLTSMTIPNSVIRIGEYAFYNCSGLTFVKILNGVSWISDYSFSGCTGLTSVTIPNSVTSIGDEAFFGCTGLTSVTIPNSVISIGGGAFDACRGLTSVTIPNSVTTIGSSAFSRCTGLTSVTIPNSVTRIGEFAFKNCTGLTSIDIPNSVTSIGSSAFYGCTGLTSVTIPNSVTSIGNRVFSGCSGLTSVTIPNSVTSIGDYAFEGCTGLTSIIVKGETPASVGSSTFYNVYKFKCTLYVPAGSKSAYENAEGWSEFQNIVEYTPGLATGSCGDNAIYTIYSDMSMVISGTGAMYDYPINSHINNDYHQSIEKVIIEEGVTSIGESAFIGCTGLTSVTIPNSVTSIGAFAFSDCTGLTSVSIPNSVTDIYFCAFYGCTGLTSIIVESETPVEVGEYVFHEVNKTSCTLYVPAGSKPAYESAYYWRDFQNIVEALATGSCGDNVTYTIYSDMSMVIYGTGQMKGYNYNEHINDEYYQSIQEVIIEEGVTSIGNRAFSGCTSLTSVTIPNSVTSIGGSAFSGCSGLTSVTIPNSVTSIYDYAFYDCTSLTSVTIPNSVTSIGNYAFDGCTGLTSVTIPNSVTEIGGSAFQGCTGLTSVTIPNSVTRIGYNAFYGCASLTSVSIPSSVTEIGRYAFYSTPWYDNQPDGLLYINNVAHKYKGTMPEGTSISIRNGTVSISECAFEGCTGLTSVTIPNSVTSIGGEAFMYCSGLTSIKCESETPATLSNGSEFIAVFWGVHTSTCILYVPAGSKSAYENAEGWKEFENIVEVEFDTDISTLDNAIYVEQTEGRIGGTKDISVKMKNDFDVRGFQFTMELPEGTTVNSWTLNQGRMPAGTAMNKVFSTEGINENRINVVCALNDGEKTFTGNDGLIGTVSVSFAEDMEEGTYPIRLTNNSISDATAEYQLELSDIKATLVLEDYVIGDTNGDGKVLVGDVIAILNYIVGSPSNNFNTKAADVNGDGKILVGDVIAVLNIIVNQ